MRFVEYNQSDAYHALSIEGYSVSAELIKRVRAGNWVPDRVWSNRFSNVAGGTKAGFLDDRKMLAGRRPCGASLKN